MSRNLASGAPVRLRFAFHPPVRLSLSSFAKSVIFGLALLGLGAASAVGADQPTTAFSLSRGSYAARFYAPAKNTAPRALVVFGSGDGGWSYWEERVCRHLAERHFAVAGVDFNAYAGADYTPEILREDYRRLAAELRRRHPGTEETPVVYGGWSMGAEQAFPAASVPAGRAPRLRGLLLVAPGGRGRYGLRLRDRMAISPHGPGTFGLRELAPHCSDLRFAVFHAGLDLLDDLKWSEKLPLDLRLWTVPRAFHDFAGAGDEFLGLVDEAMRWLLVPPAPASAPSSSP